MDHVSVPLQMIFHPVKYFRRWLNIYRQWEFWALCLVVLGCYYSLDAAGLLPRYLHDHPNVAKTITTAIILLPMPYLIARKERRLHGRDDWFMRILGRVQRGKLLPTTIAGLLGVAAISFFFPIFADIHTKAPLTGLGLILQHPIAAGIPVVALGAAAAVLWDYQEWRWFAFFWAIGASAGVFAVAGLYTDADADISGIGGWAGMVALLAPAVAAVLCLIPQKVRAK
ncbi:MAG TPA: hypothetical protein VHQ86_03155 [Candidatus Saccharimonadia bacterium]|jgi:hypothetical protein|nr:hypothetical protein [Candidatus Saccharimonadia bacterium]